MSDKLAHQTIFLTLVGTVGQRVGTRLLVDSIRSFGGALSHSPIWVFAVDSQNVPSESLQALDARVIPLIVPDTVSDYWFASKVYACAQAETLAEASTRSLVWVSSDCLMISSPLLFDLHPAFDAAVRPVHIRNIGLPAGASLNGFWKRIYEAVGVEDTQMTVVSFVDSQHIRAYFNSHVLAVNPAKRIFRRWFECFEALVGDRVFQEGPCKDELYQIFMHQAVLSALISTSIHPDRIHFLPPDYSYPYNLHNQVPPDRRAQALNDLVCVACEDRSLDPDVVNDITIHEPLRSWLSARVRRV